ncbi:FeoB-associated Cys-rich membrane protein [Psychromonas sp.]|uniref:FeoB-associated Cys-rich membrane protein n=1 Tax=Psychromonas sp. TaxID=1884585 RepID=UPI003565A618
MANIIVASIILLIIGLSISKIIIEKRRGAKCVGCALSSECSSGNKGADYKRSAQGIEIKEIT